MVTPRALAAHRLIGLDTSLFVYALERHSPFATTAEMVLDAVANGQVSAVASTLVLAELLVIPYRNAHTDVADGYVHFLTRHAHLKLVAPDLEICRSAAELRGALPALRLPDAVHLATSMASGATAFLTNDARLHNLPALTVLQLPALAEEAGGRPEP